MAIVALRDRVFGRRATYGEFYAQMQPGSKVREDIRDRAAFVYVTGQFPSHLRRNYMGILRAITASFSRPSALDGRSGTLRLSSDVVADLDLDNHPMVKKVRTLLMDGYVIQPTRGIHSRKPFGKVFMFKRTRSGNQTVTVNVDGSVLEGWGGD